MKADAVAINFGELWLKGANRRFFIDKLYHNINSALKGEKYESLDNERDRFILILNKKSNYDSIKAKLSKVFGISWFGGCITTKSTLPAIVAGVLKVSGKRKVRIEAHRSYKKLDFTSYEVVSELIKLSKKKKIDLDLNSEDMIFITAKKENTYICFDKIRGAQGLPVGSSGRAIILLSGGIDSPVAAYYAMKRGLEPIYLHIHGFPTPDKAKLKKIYDAVASLSGYSESHKVYFAPFHIFQGSSMETPRRYELVLFKRFLYMLADEIGRAERADCIVTGESLGQVASQTIDNLRSSSSGINRIIIRPLIGFDKDEIVDQGRRIGTFENSIKQYKDVCSIAIKGSELRAKAKDIDELCDDIGMTKIVRQTVAKTMKKEL